MDAVVSLAFGLGGLAVVTAAARLVMSHHRRRYVTLPPDDLSQITSLLLNRKHITGHYQGHLFRLDSYVLGKNGGRRPVGQTVAGPTGVFTRLVLEANHSPARSNSGSALPSSGDLLQAITQHLSTEALSNLRGEIFVATHGDRVIYTQPGFEIDPAYLQFLLETLVVLIDAYPGVVGLGGEAVRPLIAIGAEPAHPLRMIVPQILRDIELETTARLGRKPARFLCRRCLVRCAALKIPASTLTQVRYYGCRACGQSRAVIYWPNKVVAVLDQAMTKAQVVQDGVLYRNWLKQAALFDFGEVQIINATDEAVERFSVQAGNDTDPLRRPKYAQMRCVVDSGCKLSPNTLKVLQRTFGQVEKGRL